ncbi:pancreatic triacylglycerol lipase-like [Anthonomus grandis grandis]|uniref:pancreatic triacylglycerol lipase-like n=1 Tax=Anthonomus grandis grandis TaxID=2921223 RepID=UPI0021661290|nr:pancreatic triacylglycerol lipase-like [Anthonomus grandis grandis]
MRQILIFVSILSLSFAKSVTLLKEAQLTEELINDPRYIIWETAEGLFEVEDLQDANDNDNATLFATEDDVSFYIYTPEHPRDGVEIKESQLHNILRLTGFRINRPTLVIIHGWRNNFESVVNDRIKNAVLLNNNINVIVVDWSPIAAKGYIRAQGSVLAVGNYIGDFLLRLDDELNHRIRKLTIVGHSLGAHIAGNAGARTNGLIETIIGLDPAGPLFSKSRTDNRLDPTDGKYVHVIHTNDGMLGWGIRMGHVDYYPNGGKSQPGCGIDLVGNCAHSRAYEYYAESLTNDHFVSRLCTSNSDYTRGRCSSNPSTRMGGYPVEQGPHGDYFLATNNRSPFARG